MSFRPKKEYYRTGKRLKMNFIGDCHLLRKIGTIEIKVDEHCDLARYIRV